MKQSNPQRIAWYSMSNACELQENDRNRESVVLKFCTVDLTMTWRLLIYRWLCEDLFKSLYHGSHLDSGSCC